MTGKKDIFVDDSLPFDLTKSLEENLVMMKARFIKDGMTEKEAVEILAKAYKKYYHKDLPNI
jgi:predicted nuclease of predicted toxin-antitoxin system